MYSESLDNEKGLADVQSALHETGIAISSLIIWFSDQDYSNWTTLCATAGLIAPAFRSKRLETVAKAAAFAKSVGAPSLCAHIGRVPEDPNDPVYEGAVAAMRTACDISQQHGLKFLLETGQETSATLRRFINDVERPNLQVNFDPANMLMYGTEDPHKALDTLIPFVGGVHCKDGKRPVPPEQWGAEFRLGEGDVNIVKFLEELIAYKYSGPLTIEREIDGPQQLEDMRSAIKLINSVKARV
jgi:sugar phosphate isomerase/epimerase